MLSSSAGWADHTHMVKYNLDKIRERFFKDCGPLMWGHAEDQLNWNLHVITVLIRQSGRTLGLNLPAGKFHAMNPELTMWATDCKQNPALNGVVERNLPDLLAYYLGTDDIHLLMCPEEDIENIIAI